MMAVATVAVMSSCSKNDVNVENANPANAISFGTYVGAATKAEVETAFEAKDVFLVDAYYRAGGAAAVETFMQDQTVTATDATTWSYSPVKYWPNNANDVVDFYAVTNATATAPITAFNNYAANTVSFTVANANSDIMISSVLGAEKADGTVAFEFQHTMAQVNFTAKLAEALVVDIETDDKTEVKVTSLKVEYTSAANGGTFTFTKDVENEGTWAAGAGSRTADVWNTDGSNGIGTVLAATGDATVIGESVMILPVSSAAYTVTVVYNVYTTDDDYNANNSSINNTSTFTINPTDMNTIYNYNLEIGLTDVEVSGSINKDWGTTASDVTVDIPAKTVVND